MIGDTFGECTGITVGRGGNFSTLAAALNYISANVPMVQVTGCTGTVAVTQYSDLVTGTGTNFSAKVRYGDMIKIAGDGDGFLISSDIYHKIYNTQTGDLSIRMQEGFVGASGSGKAYEIWRPNRYTILLLDGEHEFAEASTINLPTGATVSILGSGKNNTLLNVSLVTSTIAYPRCGEFHLADMSLNFNNGTATVFQINSTGESVPALAAGFTKTSLARLNVSCGDMDGNAIVLRAGSAHIHDIESVMYDGLMNIQADKLVMADINGHTYEGAADIIVCTQYNNAAFSTKPWFISDVALRRDVAFSGGAGGMLEIQSILAGKEVRLQGITLNDLDQPNTNPNAMVISGAATAVVHLNDSKITNTGSGGGILVSNAILVANNVTNGSGGPPTVSVTGTGVYKDYCSHNTSSVAYAATITPDANKASTYKIAALTGALTIAAPLNPQTGQTLSFLLLQDGTGGRVITWNAVFKKAADGAGAANQRGVTTFKYDGTNWIQQSGALVYFT